MAYDNLKLEKGLYTTGKSFTQALEQIDPSENYAGTPLEGLDAYQRQLKRFDIKVSGIGSDTVSKFFQTSDSAALFPEYVSRAVRMVELRMFDGTDPADERLIHLAAVKALRMLEQSRWFQSGDDVTAFTAGDVTVQQSGQHKASALMLEDAEQACRGLLRDDAFAFLSV